MNAIDIFLILLFLFSVYAGYRRGFLLGALDIIRWVVSLLLGLRFYRPVANVLAPVLHWPDYWLLPFAFLAVMILTSFVVRIIEARFLPRVSPEVHTSALNRGLGVIPGAINGLIAAAVVAALLIALPLPAGIRDAAQRSEVAGRLSVGTDALESALAPIFDEGVWRTMNRLVPAEGERTFVKLPYTVQNAVPRPDLERQMLGLVNEERRSRGLDTLRPDKALVPVARAHSKDMFQRGYFSHNTPEGLTPFDRMWKSRVYFSTAGENLALARSLELAHEGLMNSPGHRANILSPNFHRVGIGILDGGIHGIMVSQEFRN